MVSSGRRQRQSKFFSFAVFILYGDASGAIESEGRRAWLERRDGDGRLTKVVVVHVLGVGAEKERQGKGRG